MQYLFYCYGIWFTVWSTPYVLSCRYCLCQTFFYKLQSNNIVVHIMHCDIPFYVIFMWIFIYLLDYPHTLLRIEINSQEVLCTSQTFRSGHLRICVRVGGWVGGWASVTTGDHSRESSPISVKSFGEIQREKIIKPMKI